MRVALVLAQAIGQTGSGQFSINLALGLAELGCAVDVYHYGGSPVGVGSELVTYHDISKLSYSFTFPVPGMSDNMPYSSSVFKELSTLESDAYFDFWKQFFKDFSLESYDVWHINHLWLASAIAKNTLKCPIVTTIHGTDLEQFDKCRDIAQYVRSMHPYKDSFFHFVSHGSFIKAASMDLCSVNTITVEPPYREDLFCPDPRVGDCDGRSIFVGKLTKRKGIEELLRAHFTLRKLIPSLHLDIVGSVDGGSYMFDEKEGKASLRDGVMFHGHLSQRDLAEKMISCEIFVFPSWAESFGMVALEAASRGLKIVMPRLSGADLTLDRMCSSNQIFLFPPILGEDEPAREKFELDFQNSWLDAIKSSRQFAVPNFAKEFGREAVAYRIMNELYLPAIRRAKLA
ncbi:glycosyltransferase family 4 protein [Hellea sp.]|nr:glycosyltransferase family 4 protein [Hellea sp.]